MYKLPNFYGVEAYREWQNSEFKCKDLSGSRESEFPSGSLEVKNFSELVKVVSFLTLMNKRHTLMFRGQGAKFEPVPRLFRADWCFLEKEDHKFALTEANREKYWSYLPEIGSQVFEICKQFGLPRWRGLKEIREIQWAVIQHYSLWPTPMIDLTTSLRVASAFAFGFSENEKKTNSRTFVQPVTGYLFVAAMPHPNGSITFDIDQHIALARLNSCCPPAATRPHLQDGFLVGRFPFQNTGDKDSSKKSSLGFRTVAILTLVDEGEFWTESHPKLSKDALLPMNDPLKNAFEEWFGDGGKYDLLLKAREL
ncbi:MAG: FRG domain-containing protein [Acidobacteria bacterium]|nr:FRG domain-containing protein [Acidobacteriota bacterium]